METGKQIKNIVVLGAGAIGCYVGAAWAQALNAAGIKLTLLGREKTFVPMRGQSITLSDGGEQIVPSHLMQLETNAEILGEADMVFVATKSTALDRVIADLREHTPKEASIVSLLNGVSPVRVLRNELPHNTIVAGMVPFNVVWKSEVHLHRSSAGKVALEKTDVSEMFAQLVEDTKVPIDLHGNLEPIQYGKLLINLANPINALSGIPLHQMLSDRAYRKIFSAVIREALAIFDLAGIEWEKAGPISPRIAVQLLKAPDWFFNHTLLPIQGLDRNSMTSMAADVQNGRVSEIDTLNGEIIQMAARSGQTAPINSKLVEEIKKVEMSGVIPRMPAMELAGRLELSDA